jgi:hypothetical protein
MRLQTRTQCRIDMYFESGKQDICIHYGREIFSTGKVTKTSMWDDDIKINFRQLKFRRCGM